MPRYLVAKLHPESDKPWAGQERCGTGAHAGSFHEYASVENVIRFGLAKPAFTAGQYNIYLWPPNTQCPEKPIRRAYKKV